MTILKPVQSSDPRISVVVPTIPSNDHSQVVDCLRKQGVEDYEVLIVDDASLDICEARNEGIKAASAEIVTLTDDDCRPGPEWLHHIIRKFDSEPDLSCVEGSVFGGRTYNGSGKYVGCNLSFNRNEALAIGGFNNDYAGWRDDTEFGWRMERDSQGVCSYVSHVQMYHPQRPRATIDNQKEERLKQEYPERYEEVIIPDTILGRMNDWLWRKGVWRRVDRLRGSGGDL